jgi:hypothetical protein
LTRREVVCNEIESLKSKSGSLVKMHIDNLIVLKPRYPNTNAKFTGFLLGSAILTP